MSNSQFINNLFNMFRHLCRWFLNSSITYHNNKFNHVQSKALPIEWLNLSLTKDPWSRAAPDLKPTTFLIPTLRCREEKKNSTLLERVSLATILSGSQHIRELRVHHVTLSKEIWINTLHPRGSKRETEVPLTDQPPNRDITLPWSQAIPPSRVVLLLCGNRCLHRTWCRRMSQFVY